MNGYKLYYVEWIDKIGRRFTSLTGDANFFRRTVIKIGNSGFRPKIKIMTV